MGKQSIAKKDSFFISKKKKNSSTPNQKFVKKPQIHNTLTASSSSGSFFIKPTQPEQRIDSKKFEQPRKTFGDGNIKSEKVKKPFDKKKWRLQKYSKKYKLEQWEERRKKNLLQEYYKQIEDEPKFDVQKIYEKYAEDEDNDNENNLNSLSSSKSLDESTLDSPQSKTSDTSLPNRGNSSKTSLKIKTKNYAQDEFRRKVEEKKQRKVEVEKKKAEKAEAIKAYKQQKLEKFKKLNKKTKKGQPIMKYRMEMLLEQIQKSIQ